MRPGMDYFRLRAFVVSLVVFGLSPVSWGDVIELDKFRTEPPNYVELTFDHGDAAADDAPSFDDSLPWVSVLQPV